MTFINEFAEQIGNLSNSIQDLSIINLDDFILDSLITEAASGDINTSFKLSDFITDNEENQKISFFDITKNFEKPFISKNKYIETIHCSNSQIKIDLNNYFESRIGKYLTFHSNFDEFKDIYSNQKSNIIDNNILPIELNNNILIINPDNRGAHSNELYDDELYTYYVSIYARDDIYQTSNFIFLIIEDEPSDVLLNTLNYTYPTLLTDTSNFFNFDNNAYSFFTDTIDNTETFFDISSNSTIPNLFTYWDTYNLIKFTPDWRGIEYNIQIRPKNKYKKNETELKIKVIEDSPIKLFNADNIQISELGKENVLIDLSEYIEFTRGDSNAISYSISENIVQSNNLFNNSNATYLIEHSNLLIVPDFRGTEYVVNVEAYDIIYPNKKLNFEVTIIETNVKQPVKVQTSTLNQDITVLSNNDLSYDISEHFISYTSNQNLSYTCNIQLNGNIDPFISIHMDASNLIINSDLTSNSNPTIYTLRIHAHDNIYDVSSDNHKYLTYKITNTYYIKTKKNFPTSISNANGKYTCNLNDFFESPINNSLTYSLNDELVRSSFKYPYCNAVYITDTSNLNIEGDYRNAEYTVSIYVSDDNYQEYPPLSHSFTIYELAPPQPILNRNYITEVSNLTINQITCNLNEFYELSMDDGFISYDIETNEYSSITDTSNLTIHPFLRGIKYDIKVIATDTNYNVSNSNIFRITEINSILQLSTIDDLYLKDLSSNTCNLNEYFDSTIENPLMYKASSSARNSLIDDTDALRIVDTSNLIIQSDYRYTTYQATLLAFDPSIVDRDLSFDIMKTCNVLLTTFNITEDSPLFIDVYNNDVLIQTESHELIYNITNDVSSQCLRLPEIFPNTSNYWDIEYQIVQRLRYDSNVKTGGLFYDYTTNEIFTRGFTDIKYVITSEYDIPDIYVKFTKDNILQQYTSDSKYFQISSNCELIYKIGLNDNIRILSFDIEENIHDYDISIEYNSNLIISNIDDNMFPSKFVVNAFESNTNTLITSNDYYVSFVKSIP